MARRKPRSLAREMGFDGDQHRLAALGLLFTEVGDNAESDGCDEYWWRTAGLNAVLTEIDRRMGKYVPPPDAPQSPESARKGRA